MPAAALATSVRRIAVVCPPGEPLLQLRTSLLGEVLAHRHRVLAIAPEFSGEEARELDDLGAERAVFAPEPHGLKLFADWKSIGGLKSILANWSPHVVLACGGKTMIYAALAAKAVGTGRVVLLVDGLPEHRFTGALGADEMPAWRYGQAMRAASEAVFYNRDDLGLLKKLGILPSAVPATVIPGAGVDLDHHCVLPLPTLGQGLVFLMISSLDKRKGVIEYCEAACALRERTPNTRFILATTPGEGATAIDADDLVQYSSGVEIAGPDSDARALLNECHVFVYPSYREGMPQRVLEAMAAGRPILTTNVAGCRETVDERVNGCLVDPRDTGALVEGIESYLKRPDLIPAMARASRAKAERSCNVKAVKRSLLTALALE
jgi:glycosyltransferase involved in cell wall biosynthesis